MGKPARGRALDSHNSYSFFIYIYFFDWHLIPIGMTEEAAAPPDTKRLLHRFTDGSSSVRGLGLSKLIRINKLDSCM